MVFLLGQRSTFSASLADSYKILYEATSRVEIHIPQGFILVPKKVCPFFAPLDMSGGRRCSQDRI
jgi:hypothetical protein